VVDREAGDLFYIAHRKSSECYYHIMLS